MKGWMSDVQSLIMRAVGFRKLRQALDSKSDAMHGDLAVRLDRLSDQLSSQGQADTERGDTVGNTLAELRMVLGQLTDQMSRQGQADTERGDTVHNNLVDLRAMLGELAGQLPALADERHHRSAADLGTGYGDPLDVERRVHHDGSLSPPTAPSLTHTPYILERVETGFKLLGREQTNQLRDFVMTLSLQTAASEATLGRIAAQSADTVKAMTRLEAEFQRISEHLSALSPGPGKDSESARR